jgi:GT2 family glycosyltransferase
VLLSIVIPTNGRRSLLATAIESCLAQELPADADFEILVVDNTPQGLSRETIAGWGDDRLRWLHAPTPGVAEARNRGVAAARGRYIAFLDDDEEASPRWAAALLAHARRGAMAVFGPIEACFETPPVACPKAAQRMFSRDLDATDGADVTARHAYLGTGNSLFDKAACFPSDRPFDTALNGLGGEDSAVLMSLAERGLRFTWAAEAWVKEHVPSDRLTLSSLATRHFRNGQVRSLVRFRAKGMRKLEGVAWMGIGLAQAAGYGLASAVLARPDPERAAYFRLKACGGAGKVLWMRPFWKITYGAAHVTAPTEADTMAAPAAAGSDAEPLVSIIVVSYRTRELTLECLRSVMRATKHASYELLVVDNASDDGSAAAIAEEFPGIRLMARSDNVGFARANNIAAKEAKGRYLLLLNPDTIVLEGGIDRLAAFAEARPAARIWGGRTLYADGSLNPTSCWRRMTLWNVLCRTTGLTGLFPSSRFFNSESYGRWDRSTVSEVDIVTGCFFLIERAFWERLGGFDARFFMYGEEADLCLRAAKLGARPAVTPEATIVHYGGASERVRSEMMIKLLAGKAELIKRHWSAPTQRLGLMLLSLWPWTRAVALELAGRLLGRAALADQAATWRTIWGARERWRHGYN